MICDKRQNALSRDSRRATMKALGELSRMGEICLAGQIFVPDETCFAACKFNL